MFLDVQGMFRLPYGLSIIIRLTNLFSSLKLPFKQLLFPNAHLKFLDFDNNDDFVIAGGVDSLMHLQRTNKHKN